MARRIDNAKAVKVTAFFDAKDCVFHLTRPI
jgi:hypothetical protein